MGRIKVLGLPGKEISVKPDISLAR